jgi:hypothetical protein
MARTRMNMRASPDVNPSGHAGKAKETKFRRTSSEKEFTRCTLSLSLLWCPDAVQNLQLLVVVFLCTLGHSCPVSVSTDPLPLSWMPRPASTTVSTVAPWIKLTNEWRRGVFTKNGDNGGCSGWLVVEAGCDDARARLPVAVPSFSPVPLDLHP